MNFIINRLCWPSITGWFTWNNSGWQLALKSQPWWKKYATHRNLFLIWIQISLICLIISKKLWRITERLAFTWQGKRLKSGYLFASGLTACFIPEALWFSSHFCIRLRHLWKLIFNSVINVKVLKMFTFPYLNQMFSHVLHLYNLTCAPRIQNIHFSVYSEKHVFSS